MYKTTFSIDSHIQTEKKRDKVKEMLVRRLLKKKHDYRIGGNKLFPNKI